MPRLHDVRARHRVGIIDDARFDAHRARAPHPERPERLEAARSGLYAGLEREAIDRTRAAHGLRGCEADPPG